ncbi:MAG: FHA domain-containing protein [Myxococcaceae bacterium]|nr:FHA domain-containing protein [Myxococcaceae bacterium]
MAPPRKTGTARSSAGEDDPERANATIARAQNPLPEGEDPERANATIAKAKNPLPEDDPERDNKTNARAPAPPRPAPKRAPPTRQPMPAEDLDEGGGYSTGQNYQAVEEGESSASLSLEGDGLDALDPELAPKTKALPALERDEGGGDEDEADDANATRAGPPIKLEIVGGPDAGKKKRFKGVRMVIGRTPGVDLQLSDQSVSRKHIELIHSDEGTLLRDLGSGNGTKLNGKKISADTMLNNGDEIQIGKTKIRFVDELAAFKKAREEAEQKEEAKKEAKKKKAQAKEGEAAEGEAPSADGEASSGEAGEGEEKTEGEAAEGEGEESAEEKAEGEEGEGEGEGEGEEKPEKSKAAKGPRSRPVRTARHNPAETGLAAKFKALNPKVRIGLIAGTVLVLLILVIGIATRPPPPPPVDPRAEQSALKMQEARTAVKDGRYEDAVKLVDDAERLSPGIDKTKLGLQAREALNIQRAFEQARTYIADKRFEDARKILTDTPKSTNRAEDERDKLEEALKAAQVEYHKAKVQEFLAAGELDAAKQLLNEIPSEQLGDLPQQVADFERTLEESKKAEEKDVKLAAANAAAARKAQRQEELAMAFAIVERKFMGGEWERAASECSRVIDSHPGDKEIVSKAKSLASTIPNFGRNYDEGMKKFRQGQLTQAAKPLRLAFQAYRSMGLTQNRYGDELAQALLKAAISAGKEALIREDLENAMANFREAKRIDPQDPDARKGFDGVAEKAEDLYQSGYMLKDRDPREALRKFKTVIAVTEPGNPVHEKAKNQVAAMAP